MSEKEIRGMNKPELTLAEMKELLEFATPEERALFFNDIDDFLKYEAPIFIPNPGPQLSAYESKADIIGFGGSAGSGKALLHSEKVLTPSGFVEIGSLNIGDTVVEPVTGGGTKVIGFYPQGRQEIYTVSVGDTKFVRATMDHLWRIRIDKVWTIADTKTIATLMKNGWEVELPTLLPESAFGIPNTEKVVAITYYSTDEAVCIKVDSPYGLFITRDYIVTHNSGLICGLSLTKHTSSLIMRDEAVQMRGLKEDLARMVGHRTGFNDQGNLWREPVPGKLIEFGSMPNPGDEQKYRGRPHDLLALDEATEMREDQVRFIQAWVRTVIQGQKCTTLMTFNPPTNKEGRWVIKYFAPWIDRNHINPALPGELRWFATIAGEDMEVADDRSFILKDFDGGEPVYDFDPKDHDPTEIIKPESRTFIPSRLIDNPFLDERYMSRLQALPEPTRSQMLLGDFSYDLADDPMQLIPSAWVDAAMERWTPVTGKMPEMDSMGVDVARGGKDYTEIARRHGNWYDKAISHQGNAEHDGYKVAGYVSYARRDDAPVHIDAIGVGTSPTDILTRSRVHTVPIISNKVTPRKDKSGIVAFSNVRSWMWWNMRELLDPSNGRNIALPKDKQLKEDLTTPTYTQRAMKIYVQSRNEIAKKIGRSPDRGTAYCMAAMETKKRKTVADMNDGYEEKIYWELA